MDNELKNKPTAPAYQLNLDMYIKVLELAQAKGKKAGDSIEEELMQIMRANPDKIKALSGKDLLDYIEDKKILDMRKKDEE